MDVINFIKFFFAGIGAFLGGLLGGLDGMLYALLAFIAIDYITGVIVAIKRKEVSSCIGFTGLAKKVFILALVAVGHIVDTSIIGSGSVVRTTVIMFYIANEGISIVENAANIGLPVPEKLKNILKQLNEKEDQ